jgi:hypothetical protein
VLRPAFAMESRPGFTCLRSKFSSAARQYEAASRRTSKTERRRTGEHATVDRLAARAVVRSEVAALDHELPRASDRSEERGRGDTHWG